MKLVEITLNTTPSAPTNYTYKLKVTKYNGSTAYIHYGKFCALSGQNKVTIDLEDILWNYRYKGSQSLEPVVSVAHNQYEMPTSSYNVLSDYWYNTVQVEDTEVTPRFASNPYTFWFLPVKTAGYKSIRMPLSGIYTPVTVSSLIPHIPSNAPAGFNWSVMFYAVSATTVHVRKDSSNLNTISAQANTAYYVPLTGATNSYSIEGNTVTVIDQCNKPYYLVWQSINGGLQCQGFLKSSEFSIKYQSDNRVDMHNSEWKVSATQTATWSLKSNNLNDDEYKAFGEMFTSPYLVLLDIENSRMYYVNIKTSDYKEKRRTRTNTKPFYFNIEVTATDHVKV